MPLTEQSHQLARADEADLLEVRRSEHHGPSERVSGQQAGDLHQDNDPGGVVVGAR